MARVTVTPNTILGPHPSSPSAGAFAITMNACDATSGNQFTMAGNEILVFINTAGSDTAGFTLTSRGDSLNRTGNLTGTIASASYAAYYAGDLEGWRQTDGYFYLTGSTTSLKFAVLRLSDA